MSGRERALIIASTTVLVVGIVCGTFSFLWGKTMVGVFGHSRANNPTADAVQEVVAQGQRLGAFPSKFARRQEWQQWRDADMQRATDDAAVLVDARAAVQGRKIGYPREAATCLEARAAMDRDLVRAMTSGGDFAAELDRYKELIRPVQTYCTYALQIGEP